MHEPTKSYPPPLSPDVPADFLECLEPARREQLLALHPLQQSYLMTAAVMAAAQEQAKSGTVPAETLIRAMMKHQQAQAALIEWGRTQPSFMADPRMQVAYQYWDGIGTKDAAFRRLLCDALVAFKPEATAGEGEEGIPDQDWGQLIVVNFGAKGEES